MKEHDFVANLRELSNYIFITDNNESFTYSSQNQEEFVIDADGAIEAIIKSTLLPVNFIGFEGIKKVVIETPVKLVATGQKAMLVKEISNIDATVHYTIKSDGSGSPITIYLTGTIIKEETKGL